MRITWFQKCLNQFQDYLNDQQDKKERDHITISFPYQIGCSLAKGKWPIYKKMIDNFANQNLNLKITLYRFKKD